MSKDKSVLLPVSTRGRSSYRVTRQTASAGGNETSGEKPAPTKRVCLGGRGREWAAESLKLLETMSTLDDAKLFLEPMNPLKYPEYYNLIRDPIDLSKIMLKFHGGSYPGLIHFTEDMNMMFDNYKRFFKDSSMEEYHQARRLSSWFDTELDHIKCKWYRIYDNGSRSTAGNANGYTARTGSLEARIQAIEAENRRIVSLASKPMSSSSMPVRLAPVEQKTVRLPQTLSATTLPNSTSTTAVNGGPVLTFRLAPEAPSSTSVKLSAPGNSQPIILMPKSCADSSRASSSQGGLMYVCADWPPKQLGLKPPGPSRGISDGGGREPEGAPESTGGRSTRSSLQPGIPSIPVAASPKTPTHSEMGLKFDVGNVWFGTARNTTHHPVTVDEEGFHFLLRNGDADVPFSIGRDEIIKCAAYFGNIRKHTLFLFVLPNCVRRLLFLGEEFTLSSLIILFPPALTQPEIAQLVYLFWRMSRLSMFGDLFCEIDQKSAVALLGNIKPTIISNIADKYKDALSGNLDAQQIAAPSATGQSSMQNGKRGKVPSQSAGSLIHNAADAFSEVDCKVEPVDKDDEAEIQDFVKLGLSSVVDNKSIMASDSLFSDGTVEDNADSLGDSGAKSDVIRKRLKIRYRPGILKHSKKRRLDERREELISEEAKNVAQNPFEESDNQFTIIEWFPEDEAAATGDDESSMASENSLNSDLQNLHGYKEENDLEIVAPSNDSDGEMDVAVNCATSLDEGEECEDLVMTGEKINIRCPITQQIMKYPVKNVHCNHCYDKQGVEELIKHRGDKAKCPVNGCSNTLSLVMEDVRHDDHLSFYIKQKKVVYK